MFLGKILHEFFSKNSTFLDWNVGKENFLRFIRPSFTPFSFMMESDLRKFKWNTFFLEKTIWLSPYPYYMYVVSERGNCGNVCWVFDSNVLHELMNCHPPPLLELLNWAFSQIRSFFPAVFHCRILCSAKFYQFFGKFFVTQNKCF